MSLYDEFHRDDSGTLRWLGFRDLLPQLTKSLSCRSVENGQPACLDLRSVFFSRLISRFREQGLNVHGFGEAKNQSPCVAGCDNFVYEGAFGLRRPSGRDGEGTAFIFDTAVMTVDFIC
ncbi:hypothetical protein [Pseudomonas orientalis]|uniref:hypothetical protein n=1 Tax=Pseudomonas orientalis TaxID=76758 RepID=UPI002FE0443F